MKRTAVAFGCGATAVLLLGFAPSSRVTLTWEYQNTPDVVLNVWTATNAAGPWRLMFVLPSEARGLILDNSGGSQFFSVSASNVLTGDESSKPGN